MYTDTGQSVNMRYSPARRGYGAMFGLMRPPRGFDPNHRFIGDIKRKDFVASVGLTEAQVCSTRFMWDFAAACRAMLPLVEFTTRALGLQP